MAERTPAALEDALLSRLSGAVAAQMGLHYPRERWPDLERAIAAAAPDLAMENAEACARRLVSAPLTTRQIKVLAGHLTVGETYFFREKRSFQVLEEEILPELLRRRGRTDKRLRI